MLMPLESQVNAPYDFQNAVFNEFFAGFID